MAFYGLAAACVAVLCIVSGVVGYTKGSASRNTEIAQYQAAIETSYALAKAAEERNAKVVERVVTVYKDRVKTITERAPAEIQLIEVIKRETPDTCLLPPAYRELWDGKPAEGSSTAQGSSGANGAPVTVADAAATAAEARKRFELNAAKLAALQEIIRSQ